MKDQNLLEYVTSNLKAHVGSWPKIAEKTGVPYHTITKIASGKTKDPGISKIQSLVDYFREIEISGNKAA
tara:strand:- start:30496 stop:30705 length:210 start_codon:yes stop_codon:yes gene_type:complete